MKRAITRSATGPVGNSRTEGGPSWRRVVLTLLGLWLTVMLAYWLSPQPSSLGLGDLTPLALNGHQRLLVLAPHCDDETLGSAGLIQAAIREGMQVKVVIETNGDGYLFATIQDFKKVYPRPQDFIHMGEIRQQESLAALALLGVPKEDVIFLSYPDRGTPSLWNDHWSLSNPFRSPFSQNTQSPYALTYDPSAVYAGQDLLGDLLTILKEYRPDLVVYPQADDVHPDHWGLNVFTRLALTLLSHEDSSYQPTGITYLVHRPDFPVVRGLRPWEDLVPPPALYQVNASWYRWDLTTEDILVKSQAIQQYRSQLPLLRGLMVSFVRVNELFAPVEDATLLSLKTGLATDPSTWKDASGKPILPVQKDPVGDFISRQALPGGDIVAVFAARQASGNLETCLQTREENAPELVNLLRFKILNEEGILSLNARTGKVETGWLPAVRKGLYTCATIPASELIGAWAVYLGATTQGLGRVLDESAWQMVRIAQP